MKYYQKFYNFMRNRYGTDLLEKDLMKFYFILIIIDWFVNSYVLLGLELLLFIIIIFRFFSKNIKKRRKENDKYYKIKEKLKKPFKNISRNYKDRNDYIYRKCHKCKTILRLPLPPKRGFRYAKCPKCKERVKVFTLRKQKQEIIRKDEVKC